MRMCVVEPPLQPMPHQDAVPIHRACALLERCQQAQALRAIAASTMVCCALWVACSRSAGRSTLSLLLELWQQSCKICTAAGYAVRCWLAGLQVKSTCTPQQTPHQLCHCLFMPETCGL